MTLPAIIANDRNLDDGLNLDLAYGGPITLFEPAIIAKGSVIQTLGGPYRVTAAPTQYEPRTAQFQGWAKNGNGHNDLYQRMHDYFKSIQGQSARLQLGSLYLDVAFGAVRLDRIMDNTAVMGWAIDAEAVPGTYGGLYGLQVGGTQSVWTSDDRRDHTSLIFTDVTTNGRVFTLACQGTAPTEIGLVLSGLVSGTTYYIVNADPRSDPICFTPAATWYYLPPSAGLICWPPGPGNTTGVNTYRIQSDTSGTLVTTGTYKAAIVPHVTVWRFLANDGNRFADGPAILFASRRAKATANTAASTPSITTSGDMAARIGLPLGPYAAANIGLVLEGAATNLVQYPEAIDNAWWTKTRSSTGANQTAPDNTTTAGTLVEDATASNTHFMTRTSVFTGSQPACIKVFGKANTRSWIVVGFDITDNTRIAYFNVSSGALGTVGSAVSAKIYSWGSGWYLCCVYTAVAPATDCVIGLANADNGKSYSGDGASSAYLWGIDCKAVPFPDSYTPNPDVLSAGGPRYADYVAVFRPHGYLTDSYDQTLSRSWTATGTGSAQPTRAGNGTAADGTAACTWTIGNIDNRLKQSFTPDVRPNAAPWTALFGLRQGTLTGANNFDLRLEDQAGALIGSAVTVAGQDLSATETKTVPVPITAAQVGATATGLQAALQGKTGTGTVIVDGVQIVRGSFRGPIIMTGNGRIPQPPDGWDWPTWLTQNGYIQWKAVLPPISTGLTYYLLGESGSNALSLRRLTGTGITQDSASKSTNNTKLAIDSISGSPAAGDYTLRVVRSGGTPADITITWNPPTGTPQSFPASGWPLGSFPLALVGGGTAGTLTVSDNSGPPTPNGTYDDTVTVTASPYIVTVARKADGGVQSSAVDVGNVWDGALHTFKIEWRHYTTSAGVETMTLILSVDGVAKYTSGNLFAAGSVTKWSDDERLWLSKGEVYSTIRNLTIGSLIPGTDLPRGAIPAIAKA